MYYCNQRLIHTFQRFALPVVVELVYDFNFDFFIMILIAPVFSPFSSSPCRPTVTMTTRLVPLLRNRKVEMSLPWVTDRTFSSSYQHNESSKSQRQPHSFGATVEWADDGELQLTAILCVKPKELRTLMYINVQCTVPF